MASCLLAALLLFSGCGQQENSNKAAIQQESYKNLIPFFHDSGPRTPGRFEKKFTRGTGKTLEKDFHFSSYLLKRWIPFLLQRGY
jgi:hypothetical protein